MATPIEAAELSFVVTLNRLVAFLRADPSHFWVHLRAHQGGGMVGGCCGNHTDSAAAIVAAFIGFSLGAVGVFSALLTTRANTLSVHLRTSIELAYASQNIEC